YQRKPLSPVAYFPKTFLYSRAHCWLAVEGLTATVGLTEFVFDIVYREYFYALLPDEKQPLLANKPCGALDALKVALPIISPVSGVVLEVNEDLRRMPSLTMTSPYSRGWLWRMSLGNPIELKRL